MISDHVESNMMPISDFTNCNAKHCPYSKLHDFGPCKIEYIFRYDTKSFTNPSANLRPIPILPTSMPTTAHIQNYMISDHVESNICISLDTKSFTNPSANLCPFPIVPTAMPTTAHIRNYMISDHVESNICISL